MADAPTHSRAWLAWLVLLAVTVAGAISPPARAQATELVALRWKWTAGETLRYRSTQEMTQTVRGGDDREVTWLVSYALVQKVTAVTPSGVATVEQTYESCQVNASERPGESVKYDSTKKQDEKLASHRLVKPYSAFVGKTVTFEITPEGQVLSLKGAAAILAEAFDAVGESNPLAAPLIEIYKGTLSEESLRAALERQLRVVPDRQVKPRDTWTVESDQTMPVVGTIRHELEHRLDRVQRTRDARTAVITTQGKLTQGGAANDPLAALMSVTMTRSSVSGKTAFDANAGRIAQSEAASEMVFEIAVKLPGLDGEGGPEKIEHSLRQMATLTLMPTK